MMKFYGYDRCSTCRKAKKFLADRKIPFENIDITINPPPKRLLKQIVSSGAYTIGRLFNTSGLLYREMKIKDKYKELSEENLIDLLSRHGKLIRRPIITDGEKITIGFDEGQMREQWR
jgi:arsenate reductase